MFYSLKKNCRYCRYELNNVCDIRILLDDWEYFWNFCDFGIYLFLLINGCFWVVKIIRIVGKLWNCGIIYNLLIYFFFRIIGIFFIILLWKNNYIWLLKIIEVMKNYVMLV